MKRTKRGISLTPMVSKKRFQLSSSDLSLSYYIRLYNTLKRIYNYILTVTEIQKDVVISKAEAEKQKRILEGEGASEALRLLKFAKTKGLKEMANELNITDVEALYKIDALVEAIKANRSTDISLIGEDVGDVVKILTTLKSIEQKQG